MSYGTITSGGSIDTSCSFSNDFTVKSDGTGTYVLTFLEWMATKPTLTITPSLDNPSKDHSAAYSISQNTSGQYQATVYIFHDTSRENRAFGFRARFGHALSFTAPSTLTLTPSVISFGSPSTQILVLSTTISLVVNGSPTSFNAFIDAGTSLLCVGTAMTLSLGATSVSDGNGNTWDLTGYTYGGGSGVTGKEWSGKSTTLSIGTGGPITAPESFVVKGTPHQGNSNKSTLSTDPVVRLTSVAPGGLAV
jgi:hypothetical protein